MTISFKHRKYCSFLLKHANDYCESITDFQIVILMNSIVFMNNWSFTQRDMHEFRLFSGNSSSLPMNRDDRMLQSYLDMNTATQKDYILQIKAGFKWGSACALNPKPSRWNQSNCPCLDIELNSNQELMRTEWIYNHNMWILSQKIGTTYLLSNSFAGKREWVHLKKLNCRECDPLFRTYMLSAWWQTWRK